MTDTESMSSSMGLFSQPCGIKRTIDQVAEETSADYNVISCQPWHRQPVSYFHPGKQARDMSQAGHDEPMCFNRRSSPDVADSTSATLGHNILHNQSPQVDLVPGRQVYSVECSSSVAAESFTTTASSARANYNGATFNKYSYASGDMYSPVAKDETHNAIKPQNEAVIQYGQQPETRQVAPDQFREADFNHRQTSIASVEYRKRYDDPLTTPNDEFIGNTQHLPKAEDKYWSFGWNTNCPKRTQPGSTQQAFYHKPNLSNYSSDQNFTSRDAFQDHSHVQVAEQQIQCDENGKSYIELSGKTSFTIQEEWRPTWNPAERQNAYALNSQQQCSSLHPVNSESTTNEDSRNWHSSSQSFYRHQRLSILSLSMFKLNRFRQCSDPSLHKSVLICNTLRHIEDEMEREEFFKRRPKQKTRGQHQFASQDFYHQAQNANCYEANNAATKCLNDRHSNLNYKKNYENGVMSNDQTENYGQEFDTRPSPHLYVFRRNLEYDRSFNSMETCVTQLDAHDKIVSNSRTEEDVHRTSSVEHNEEVVKYTTTPVANELPRCAEEPNREIDWGSVLAMSSAGLECLNPNSTGIQQAHQPLNRSDFIPSEASFFVTNGTNQAYNEHGSSWKDSQYASSVSVNPRHSLSDFTVLRRRSELADELDGFVQILVGS